MSLHLQILRILLGCPATGIAVAMLRIELGSRIGRACGDSELTEALHKLRAKNLVADGTHAITDDPTVFLTPRGRKEAAQS